MSRTTVVEPSWLADKQAAEEEIIVLDVRFVPRDVDYGKRAYDKGHIPGALFVSFKHDLSVSPQQHGGNNPLPTVAQLAHTFGQLGITRNSTVVVYEDVIGPAAAKLWWVLRYLGVEKAYVLDGGINAWYEAGLLLTTEVPQIAETIFEPVIQKEWLVDVEEIRRVSTHKTEEADTALDQKDGNFSTQPTQSVRSVQLIDSRDIGQYSEGHIPNAEHYFWKDILDVQGRLLPTEQIKQHFAALDSADEFIVYCGSGVSAAVNILALKEAGCNRLKLYGGSWSDWVSYEGNTVVSGT